MFFKKRKRTPPPEAGKLLMQYTPEEANMLLECCDFTLRELECMVVRNMFDHGSIYTSKELETIHKMISFCTEQIEKFWRFIEITNERSAQNVKRRK